MDKRYFHPLPPELVKHVSGICGADGDNWLAGLHAQVDELRAAWSIEVREPFVAGEFNFVAPATRLPDGDDEILKIAPPYSDQEYLREAEFLRARKGRGAVHLLEQDVGRRAILIERAVPGANLAEIFEKAKHDSLAPAIAVLRRLVDKPPVDLLHRKTIDEWFDGLRRYHEKGFPADYAIKALAIYERLTKSADSMYYLHGDFHPANVVSSTRDEYLAIDPKGMIGHIGYDIAVFLNNFHWWQENEAGLQSKLDAAVLSFSEAFDMSPIDLREWAFAQMVLGAWWSFDEMPEHYEESTVAKADIWNV